MNGRLITIAALCAVLKASAQTADTSNNVALSGDYFIREVQMTGSTAGIVTSAASAIGVATFDGKGNYTFRGQGTNLTSGLNSSMTLTGTYGAGSNGFLRIQSFAVPTDFDYGGIAAVGPVAFVASATEGKNVTMLVGIQAGASVANSSFKGSYTAAALDFPGAVSSGPRQATFSLTPDGAGNLGTVAISGVGAALGGTTLSQTATGVTYSLAGEGSGTITFGAAATGQLVSGTKNFYISADGNIIMGGSPNGYDFLIGLRSLATPATNSTANGIYFMAALEDQISSSSPNVVDAFYGSANSTGSGVTLFHNRTQSFVANVFDFTYDAEYTLGADGTIPFGGSSTPYEFAYGAAGKAFIATGNAAATGSLYSLTLGLEMPVNNTAATGVYIYPNGIVNAGTFAPITNPIAPNEFITIFGVGLSASTATATTLPLPTTLGNVQVTINGTLAPLDFVSPGEIVALVPSGISPGNGVPYATIQVKNNTVASNSVTVYTDNSSPGVFAFNPTGAGSAAAEHANYSVITGSSPASVGETITLYLTGLGRVSPAVSPDGGPAPSSPPSLVTDPAVNVDFSGVKAATPLPYVGLTPTAAGLYQINVAIPSGVSSSVYVDVGTSDGYTSEATMSTTTAASHAEQIRAERANHLLDIKKRGTRQSPGEKAPGIPARAQ